MDIELIGLLAVGLLAGGGVCLWRHGRAQGKATARKAWEEVAPGGAAAAGELVSVVTHNPMSGFSGHSGRARSQAFTEGSQ